MEQEKFNKLKLITSLTKIGHGDLNEFFKIGLPTVQADPYLFAHFLAWNHKNGKIFDSKVAFPVIALRGDPQFAENAICHLVSLGPRELNRAYLFSKELTKKGNYIKGNKRKIFQWAIQKYLDIRQSDKKWFDKCVMQHRKAMKALYAVSHKKPSTYAQQVLFENKYPRGSIFDTIRNLKNMQPKEAAGNIINYKIPLTVAIGAVSSIKNDDIQLALLEGMSGNELLNNTKMFERLGVMEKPALKAAFDNAIERAKKDKKVNIYKASRAKNKVDAKTAKKLISVQKEQEKKQKGIEGDWLVLGDHSLSMTRTIDIARRISALIASQIKGKVYLVFFNNLPKFFDVTGMDYQQIHDKTKFVVATGPTSIGCGLDYIDKKDIVVNGMVIVSDGGDNSYPLFKNTYDKYTQKFNFEPTVYHLWVPGDSNRLTMDYVQRINISKDFDEYAYSNLLNILKTNRYQLLDDIYDTPLLTFKKVFKENYNAN